MRSWPLLSKFRRPQRILQPDLDWLSKSSSTSFGNSALHSTPSSSKLRTHLENLDPRTRWNLSQARYMSFINTKGTSAWGSKGKLKEVKSDCPEEDDNKSYKRLISSSQVLEKNEKKLLKQENLLVSKGDKSNSSSSGALQHNVKQQHLLSNESQRNIDKEKKEKSTAEQYEIIFPQSKQQKSLNNESHGDNDKKKKKDMGGKKKEIFSRQSKQEITSNNESSKGKEEGKSSAKTNEVISSKDKQPSSLSTNESQRDSYREKQSNYKIDFTKVKSVPNPSKEEWWYPDPYTGFYVPRSHFGKISPSLLEKKSKDLKKSKTSTLERMDKSWWTSMEDLPDSLS